MRRGHYIARAVRMPQVGLCLLVVMTKASVEVGRAEGYRAKEVGRHIELMTPNGNRVLFGDFAFDTARDYKISIPLKDLMTPKAPSDDSENEDAQDEAIGRAPQSLPPLPQDPNAPAAAPYTPNPSAKNSPTVEYDDTEKLVVEANHFYNKGKFYEASMYVEELIRKRPTYVRGWVMKGSLLFVQGHKDLAKKAWEQARTLEPENKEVKDLFERYKLP